jgi:hypothetical protein
MVVTAPNGVKWKRLPGGTSSAGEFLAVLASLRGGRVARNWNLWQEGRSQREDGRQREVLFQWERAGPPPGPRPPDEEVRPSSRPVTLKPCGGGKPWLRRTTAAAR